MKELQLSSTRKRSSPSNINRTLLTSEFSTALQEFLSYKSSQLYDEIFDSTKASSSLDEDFQISKPFFLTDTEKSSELAPDDLEISIVYRQTTKSDESDGFFGLVQIVELDQFFNYLQNYPSIIDREKNNFELLEFRFNFNDILNTKWRLYYDDLNAKKSKYLSEDCSEKSLDDYEKKTPKALIFCYLSIILIIELMNKSLLPENFHEDSSFSNKIGLNEVFKLNRFSKDSNNSILYSKIKEEFCNLLKKFQKFDKKKFYLHDFLDAIEEMPESDKTLDLLKSYRLDCKNSLEKIKKDIQEYTPKYRCQKANGKEYRNSSIILKERIEYLVALCDCGLRQYEKIEERDQITLPSDAIFQEEFLQHAQSTLVSSPRSTSLSQQIMSFSNRDLLP
jgi:hypothetical protein